MNEDVEDALLHERLQTGALEVTPSTSESQAQLRAMIARAEREAEVKPCRRGLIISGSLVAALALGGATVPGMINPFRQESQVQVQEPLFDYEYTLPSGFDCTGVYGVFADADPDAVDTIRQADTVPPRVDDADVAPVIADMRENPDTTVNLETGSEEPGGYGTKYYDEDEEYMSAVSKVMESRLEAELSNQGLSADALSVNRWAEDTCPGKEW